jgi:UDPglucose 6-dehydrogenase
MKTIGVIGFGFVGQAIYDGMKHAFNVKWYDKNLNTAHQKLGDYCDSLEDLLLHVTGPIFVCVPTPMDKDGSCNTSIVESVVSSVNEISKKLVESDNNNKLMVPILIIKSTVAPGTTERLNKENPYVQCVFNPEFLRESCFLEDFKRQDRIIIGGPPLAVSAVKAMYQTAYPSVPTTKTSSTIAEMVKYVTNCFLAVKVSFANEIHEICEKLNIDYDKVVEYATKDTRLGLSHWAVPGPDGKVGFSGSCFPKDLNALIYLAKSLDCSPEVLEAAWETNLRVRPEKDWEKLKGRAVV